MTPFTISQFEGRIGDTFRVIDADGPPLELDLVSAETVDEARPAELPQAFDLLFHGPLEPVLPQRIYRLENDSMDPLEIFIVPIGPVEGAMRYQAAFG